MGRPFVVFGHVSHMNPEVFMLPGVFAEYPNLSRGRVKQGRDHAQKRSLSRSISAEDSVNATLFDVDGHVVQGLDRS